MSKIGIFSISQGNRYRSCALVPILLPRLIEKIRKLEY